ncbi:hypothetical protein CC79DRAFT_1365419 [Sarocladium strictum]
MAPLILHNVPDDECYVGDDGIKRPYAMIFNQQDAPSSSARSRRTVAETGSFGKSTRRSRSRTGTPAGRTGRENPTLAAADKLFGDWVSNQTTTTRQQTQAQQDNDTSSSAQRVVPASQPVEMMLRGYRSSLQQYAAISHYESLAGRILEDYPRDPPAGLRRYKSELRDPAFTRSRVLSADERAMVNRADGGEHWIKITFESAEAAEAAVYASPQRILGHLVYAEPYRGVGPAKDEPCPDVDFFVETDHIPRSQSLPANVGTPRRNNNLPTSFSSRLLDLSPGESLNSSQTMETNTLSTGQSSNTIPALPSTSVEPLDLPNDSVFCRRIPTARKAQLLPADQALLPQQSVTQRFLNAIPFMKWFGGSIIGNEIPRTETGEFDWHRASLYWKVIWWLDATFGLFKGDVYSIDKDE